MTEEEEHTTHATAPAPHMIRMAIGSELWFRDKDAESTRGEWKQGVPAYTTWLLEMAMCDMVHAMSSVILIPDPATPLSAKGSEGEDPETPPLYFHPFLLVDPVTLRDDARVVDADPVTLRENPLTPRMVDPMGGIRVRESTPERETVVLLGGYEGITGCEGEGMRVERCTPWTLGDDVVAFDEASRHDGIVDVDEKEQGDVRCDF